MMQGNTVWKVLAIVQIGLIVLLYSTSQNSYLQTDGPGSLKTDGGVQPQKKGSPQECATAEFNFTGVSQEDPKLIDYIRQQLMKPPSPLPYKLIDPKKVHYSQFGQSKHADEKYFHGMRDGFFIEVGAAEGEYLSNTLYFEKELGWRGLLIEPYPTTYKYLLAKNRKAYSINAALATAPEASEVYFRPQGRLGWMSRISNKGIKVKSLPLYSLLSALEVKVVDFFSLDIESLEVKVLKTIPWDKVKFRIMMIEYKHIPEGLDKMTEYLVSKGYRYLGLTLIDAWYGWPELLDELNLNETTTTTTKKP